MNPESKIVIFTDGSSRGNPGPGGFGAVIAVSFELLASRQDEIYELGGRENHTTNNRMELSAAISALSFLNTYKLEAESYKLTLHSDSRYVINGATKWVYGWQKNGWLTAQKKEVENQDLWEGLVSVMTGKKINWQYVGGHVGIAGNERCDEIATAFADNLKPSLYAGPLSAYPVKSILSVQSDTHLASTKESAKNHSKAKAFSYVSSIAGITQVHATWAECEKRVKGASGARYKKVFSKDEEVALIKAWTN